jgi:putative aldouronate transport system permease protein
MKWYIYIQRKGDKRVNANLLNKVNNNLLVPHKQSKFQKFIKNVKRDKYLLLLMLLPVSYYIIFCYVPMYGSLIAFKDFVPTKGILGSDWAGLKWFNQFFSSIYFMRLLKNTILMSVYGLLWGFPIPIIFALLLNEIKDGPFKRITQTVSYLPHFISVVVVVGMMVNMLAPTGVLTAFIQQITGKSFSFLSDPAWFRTVYIGSGVWQEFGWNSIIYLAAISSIDPTLYEAARVDSANRLQQVFHITIPQLIPTIIILLILNAGNILNVGFEKIILMYSPSTYETADVISTYVYRAGILQAKYSFGAAVGLFNSVANFIVLVFVNWFSGKVSETSLW